MNDELRTEILFNRENKSTEEWIETIYNDRYLSSSETLALLKLVVEIAEEKSYDRGYEEGIEKGEDNINKYYNRLNERRTAIVDEYGLENKVWEMGS